MKHINENKRSVGKEGGEIFKTDDPKQFVRVYSVQENIDLNRIESDLKEFEELKTLHDLLIE